MSIFNPFLNSKIMPILSALNTYANTNLDFIPWLDVQIYSLTAHVNASSNQWTKRDQVSLQGHFEIFAKPIHIGW